MHPGDDPALAARFLGWLQAHGRPTEGLARDLARLTELRAWESAQPVLPSEPDAPRLNDVLRSWREFARELPSDWVELSGGSVADGVTWIDPDADLRRAAPQGPAPRLMDGSSPPERRRPARSITAAVLFVFLMALAFPLAVATSSRTEALATIEAWREQAACPLAWSPRDWIQQVHGPLQRALRIREAQRDAVNRTCEGDAWCLGRLRELDAVLRALRHALEATEDATDGVAVRDTGSSRITMLQLGSLSEELELLESAITAAPPEDARLRVLIAEAEVLRAALDGRLR